ncbi:cyclin [Aspergillus steynii IBT 23096]|uniref:Cyclin n=1 Tax=Aspergillus steynii IBT 23096 TaxID=1392250 RepID=A0A2I2G3R3_9EURO|nr:cyclin [Aspergillus steynii IBT 23096]PLB47515.1 cyclin [Aspergillus steynii IBT 23096]
MDFHLRCNSLKCRSPLKERAVVTTCSHIFCLKCADTLGLSHPTTNERHCPACHTLLVNPDDAVATVLNPTEDYKTSVLSGLDPNTIMECAGRALLFWTYQTTQEIVYQEFLAKTLTDKYATINTHMDKVIHNANTEISSLQTRLSDMQASQEQLQKKNQELVDLYRDKCKKLTQITNLYNLLKSRAMRSQMQTAASDTVSSALNTMGRSGNRPPVSAPTTLLAASVPLQTPASFPQNTFPVNQDGVEQIHRHQRSGTGSSKKARAAVAAMPPPGRPLGITRNRDMPNATPQHRTRLTGPSRPSTSTSHLQDSVLFERFRADPNAKKSPPNQHVIPDRGRARGQSFDQAGPAGTRTFFDSSIR